jgi:hypothetical protein
MGDRNQISSRLVTGLRRDCLTAASGIPQF